MQVRNLIEKYHVVLRRKTFDHVVALGLADLEVCHEGVFVPCHIRYVRKQLVQREEQPLMINRRRLRVVRGDQDLNPHHHHGRDS